MSTFFLGKDTDGLDQNLRLDRANRHGMVAGATGTGKTVTLQILSEGFSKAGVPVFAADVKGDLSGISQAGSATGKLHNKLRERAQKIGLSNYNYEAMPVTFWDLHGQNGHPIRATISEMGPMLLSRLLDLTDVQEGVMHIAFDVAENNDWPLIDLKDLKATLTFIAENNKDLALEYGNIASASVGAIIRDLLVLKREGADKFFGEPALKLSDLMRRADDGRGMVNILAAEDLINTPRLYSTFLLWLMSELFEELPEVGDPEKPVMAFFFDEAHLLFDGAPKALVEKISQVARLIRSKGVSLWFVTQNPSDIPDDVLGQIGNRVQHALRGYTPKEQKAIRATAEAFRPNPKFKTKDVIAELSVGEALVSVMDSKGRPQVVGKTLIRPPASRIGPATPAERGAIISQSPMGEIYDTMVDRKSAFEMLTVKRDAARKASQKAAEKAVSSQKKTRKKSTSSRSGRKAQSVVKAGMKAGARSIATSIGRQIAGRHGAAIARGILGGFMRR